MADWVENLFDSATTAATDAATTTATTAWWDRPRGTASVALLAAYGADLGVEPRRSLAGTGIGQSQLQDPEAEITAGQELALVANLIRILGDRPGLGLGAGLRYGLHVYGIFGFAVLSSATLGEGIALAERFRELAYALVDVHSERVGAEMHIVLDARNVPPPLRRFAIERDAAAITLMPREMLAQPLGLARVTLTAPAPPTREELNRYEEVFGALPQFHAPADTLVLDAALLELALPRASEFAAAQCQAQCQVLLERRHQRAGTAGRVRSELLRDPRGMAGEAEVARSLSVSPRTLRRRLAEEGTSFRAIVTETRGLLAQELLETGQLTVDQVADRLGYAEASSFIHAFTRWSGVSPGRWMREARIQSDRH